MINGQVTELPDSINPNKIIQQKMKEKYGTCPFCGETKTFWEGCKGTGRQTGIMPMITRLYKNYGGLFSKKIYSQKDTYICHTCGAKWETPYYPIDLVDEKTYKKISKLLFGDEQ